LAKCQQPLTLPHTLVCSLGVNFIKAEGAKYFAEALKVNSTLTCVEYAATRTSPA